LRPRRHALRMPRRGAASAPNAERADSNVRRAGPADGFGDAEVVVARAACVARRDREGDGAAALGSISRRAHLRTSAPWPGRRAQQSDALTRNLGPTSRNRRAADREFHPAWVGAPPVENQEETPGALGGRSCPGSYGVGAPSHGELEPEPARRNGSGSAVAARRRTSCTSSTASVETGPFRDAGAGSRAREGSCPR